MNAADEGDVLDEAAERQAFMDAVAEWRKADAVDGPKQPLRIEREYLGKGGFSAKASTGADSKSGAEGRSGSLVGGDAGAGMWKNPFAPPSAENEVFDDSPVYFFISLCIPAFLGTVLMLFIILLLSFILFNF